MPDLPAVSAAQLSETPRPRDVTTPTPVTTTTGLPRCSVVAAISFVSRSGGHDEGGTPVAAIADCRSHYRSRHTVFHARLVLRVERRIVHALVDRQCSQRDGEG